MLGIESEGMILMAENNKGELQFVAPQGGIDNGSVIACFVDIKLYLSLDF